MLLPHAIGMVRVVERGTVLIAHLVRLRTMISKIRYSAERRVGRRSAAVRSLFSGPQTI